MARRRPSGTTAIAATAVAALSACSTQAPAPAAPTSATAPAAAAQPPPCAAGEHRQFDFWLGDWDVYQSDGKLAGRNLIERVLGGCVIRESWSGRGGFAGFSLNGWDRDDRRWHQSWYDNQGGRLELAGGRVGDAMVLGSASPHPDPPGATKHQRITWTPLRDGAVRQLWEVSDDGGRSWRVEFDGRYVRRP